jgi:hypothetical protein
MLVGWRGLVLPLSSYASYYTSEPSTLVRVKYTDWCGAFQASAGGA